MNAIEIKESQKGIPHNDVVLNVLLFFFPIIFSCVFPHFLHFLSPFPLHVVSDHPGHWIVDHPWTLDDARRPCMLQLCQDPNKNCTKTRS